jgi:hypothetical protein
MNNNVPDGAQPIHIDGMPYYVNLYATVTSDSATGDSVTVYTQCNIWVDKEPRNIGTYSAEYFRDCHRDVMEEATSKLCQLHGFSKAIRYE